MPEQFITRTEYSRSMEDAEKYRAIETLKEVGLLVPLSELETFHGRVGSKSAEQEWGVDPTFANGGSDSGNDNVNKRPTLYTGEKALAQEFASERGREEVWAEYARLLREKVALYTPQQRQEWLNRLNGSQYNKRVYTLEDLNEPGTIRREAGNIGAKLTTEERAALQATALEQARATLQIETHQITSADSDAMVIDLGFDETKLDKLSLAQYQKALETLLVPVTEGSPMRFEARDAAGSFSKLIRTEQKGTILASEVHEVATKIGVDDKDALQLAGAYNAYRYMSRYPVKFAKALLYNSSDIIMETVHIRGQDAEAPINLEYVQRLLRNAHIVGVQQQVDSATVGRSISSISLFDLEKTDTVADIERDRNEVWRRLGALAEGVQGMVPAELATTQPLLRELEDAHAKPEKLVDGAMQVAGYNQIFEASAGNWEGYTLAEHTETVLRNFDENYAEKVPVELLAPLRLAILCHDIGKPAASARGEKHRQKEYNLAQAKDFLTKLGIDTRLQGLIIAAIGDGADLAYRLDVVGDRDTAPLAMKQFATDTMQQFFGTETVSNDQIRGFVNICRILQQCDGGAYTSMAITRRTGGGRYRNAPSFNATYAQPTGFGRRTITPRKPGESAAQPDLTPEVTEKQLEDLQRPGGIKDLKLSA